MSQVADADALVVDLRENHGGDPHTIAFVASYLFDAKPVHINDLFFADKHTTEQFWTLKDVKGARFGGKKPMYVLTSHATFSGGEELAYDRQALHRAPVIGETTGGGAHPSDLFDLDDWFHIIVPRARPINPVTKTDWEGVGVKPAVAVPSHTALEEVLRRARQDIAKARGTGQSPR
jgi:C-terminal processing protease CtpA/Prc